MGNLLEARSNYFEGMLRKWFVLQREIPRLRSYSTPVTGHIVSCSYFDWLIEQQAVSFSCFSKAHIKKQQQQPINNHPKQSVDNKSINIIHKTCY